MKTFTFMVSLLLSLVYISQAQAQTAIIVTPSGVDDTADIQAAFDSAAAAGPGSIVQFTEGNFHVSEPIIIRGFSGEWRGAGKEKTIIEVAGDPSRECHDRYGAVPQVETGCFPITKYSVDNSPPLDALAPFIFIEAEGAPPVDLFVAELSIHLIGVTDVYYIHHIPAPLNAYLYAIEIAGERRWEYDGEISRALLQMDRVIIKGQSESIAFGEVVPINVVLSVAVNGGGEGSSNFPDDYALRKTEYIQADVSIIRSHFEGASIALSLAPIDSNVVMGGSSRNANTFDRIGTAIRIKDPSNSRVEFSHNDGTVSMGGLFLSGQQYYYGNDDGPQTDVPLPEPSQVNVSHNDLTLQKLGNVSNGGVLVEDTDYFKSGTKRLDVLIDKNSFLGLDDPVFGPTWGAIDVFSAKDLIATNNKITGTYLVGGITAGYCVFAGCPWPPARADGTMILGNNLQNITDGLLAAPIWLGPFTELNTVVGGKNDTNVIDQGVDNTVVGVNNMNGNPPGPNIMEALENRRRLLLPGS